MATVFHESPYSRFIEIKSNLRKKKLNRTNQGSNFLVDSFSNRDNVRAPIQFGNPSILQDDFSPELDSSIFTSIAPQWIGRSNELSWVVSPSKSTSHFLPYSTVFRMSGSISEANLSCCHRSDACNIDSNVTENIIRKVNNVW